MGMKRSSKPSKKVVGVGYKNNNEEVRIDWELRPGGMLVQKRGLGTSGDSVIKIKVSHGSSHHEISVPSQSTFGTDPHFLFFSNSLLEFLFAVQ